MTCQLDFSGVWIKLKWAKEHISNLEALAEGFKQSYPYGVVSYCELGRGAFVFRARVLYQPPLWWSAVVGDAIYNLRSSLDLLVCEFVRTEENEVKSNTGFPVLRSATACANAFNPSPLGQLYGAVQLVIDLIKAANPYYKRAT